MKGSSIMIPVLATRGSAYLLLNTIESPLPIHLEFPSPSPRLKATLDKELKGRLQTAFNIQFLKIKCHTIFKKIIINNEYVYICLIFPDSDFAPKTLATKFSTAEISSSIMKSTIMNDAEKQAQKIIKSFRGSFVSNKENEILLAKALFALHAPFIERF